jgi:hypothetical protein
MLGYIRGRDRDHGGRLALNSEGERVKQAALDAWMPVAGILGLAY